MTDHLNTVRNDPDPDVAAFLAELNQHNAEQRRLITMKILVDVMRRLEELTPDYSETERDSVFRRLYEAYRRLEVQR